MGGFLPGKLLEAACTSREDTPSESSCRKTSQERLCLTEIGGHSLRTTSRSTSVIAFEKRFRVRPRSATTNGVLKPTTVHQELRVLRRMLNVAVRKKLLQANPCWGV